MKYVHGMLLEDPFDVNTRGTVCGILIEALSSQDDMYMVPTDVEVCDISQFHQRIPKFDQQIVPKRTLESKQATIPLPLLLPLPLSLTMHYYYKYNRNSDYEAYSRPTAPQKLYRRGHHK